MGSEIEKEIEKLTEEIKASKQKLAALRKKAPPAQFENYSFLDSFGQQVTMAALFGNKEELILVHNMGTSCSSCTMWADGFNGVLKHLENRAAFVVETPDKPVVQRQFAADRAWGFRMVSSSGTGFRKDMGYADKDGSPWPGVSIFTKDGNGKIFRVSDSVFGPGDNFNIVWDLFDLLPKGWDDFDTDYFYSKVR